MVVNAIQCHSVLEASARGQGALAPSSRKCPHFWRLVPVFQRRNYSNLLEIFYGKVGCGEPFLKCHRLKAEVSSFLVKLRTLFSSSVLIFEIARVFARKVHQCPNSYLTDVRGRTTRHTQKYYRNKSVKEILLFFSAIEILTAV